MHPYGNYNTRHWSLFHGPRLRYLTIGVFLFLGVFWLIPFILEGNDLTTRYWANTGVQVVDVLYQNEDGQVLESLFDSSNHIHHIAIRKQFVDPHGEEIHNLIYMMATVTQPPFIMSIGEPFSDFTSNEIWRISDMEPPTRRMFQYLLIDSCPMKNEFGMSPMVVDVGANLGNLAFAVKLIVQGFLSAYSAVMGCDVTLIEPQPRLFPFIENTLKVNGISHKVELNNYIIYPNETAKMQINYAFPCWACSKVSLVNETAIPNPNITSYRVPPKRLENFITRDVLLMKIDVEGTCIHVLIEISGYEVMVLESALPAFRRFNIQNVLIEWGPKRWPHPWKLDKSPLHALCEMGYKIRHYELRMELPTTIATPERVDPLIKSLWTIPCEKVEAMTEYLYSSPAYGEANLWLSKQ